LATLGFRQRLTYLAHLYKAAFQQHHGEMRALFAPYVPADATVVDIGAHAGQFTKLFAKLAPRGRVIAVEPQSYARAILRPALRLNGLAHVEIIGQGLSDHPGEAQIFIPVKRSGSLGFGLASLGDLRQERAAIQETVSLTTLDALADQLGLARLDFIKIDVEGFEGRVLAGATRAITRHRPALLAEMVSHHLARAGDTPDGVLAPFRALGYRIFRLAPAPMLVTSFAGDADYLLLPPGAADPPGAITR